MNQWNTANLDYVQSLNRLIVLNLLREKREMSRADISKTTQLSPTTVSVAVSNLIDCNLVKEVGMGTSTGGKRPILLQFNGGSKYIVSMLINQSNIYSSIIDLNGEIKYKDNTDITDKNSEERLRCLYDSIAETLKKADEANLEVIAISVGISGIVNRKRGIVTYSSTLGWNNLNLKQELEKRFNRNIFIVNDVNAAAFGEKIFGQSRNIKDLLYIMVEATIGAGMIIENKIYDGHSGSAVEFGHMSVDVHGSRCECGNYGCLKYYASETFIKNRIREEINKGHKSTIDIDNISIENIIDAIDKKDKVVTNVVEEGAFNLAIGITNLINIFNPEIVIVSGYGIVNSDYYFQHLKENIFSMTRKINDENLVITNKSISNPFLRGIAALAIESMFELPIIKK